MYNYYMNRYRNNILIIILSLLIILTSCQKTQNLETLPQYSKSVVTTVSQTQKETLTTTKIINTPTPSQNPEEKEDINIELLNKLNSEQVILIKVENKNDFHAKLFFYEKVDNNWIKQIDNIQATVGKNGIYKQKEGDSKSPFGIFSLGSAFGYENKLDTAYPFLQTIISHHWVDDVNSKYYNQLVNYIDGGIKDFNSSEQLITFDVYKYGIFINYNRENEKGLGSAIFMHIYRSTDSPTGGCVALDEQNLKYIIEHLNINKNPLIVIGEVDKVNQPNRLNNEFVFVKDIIPDILVDAKYYTNDNFLGRQVDGYMSNTAILKYDATLSLSQVQKQLLKNNLSLIIYDAYRPKRAVEDFVNWVSIQNDTINKQKFYPDINKDKLIEYGYIGKTSNHSKGNTVDLSIIDLKTGEPLDMGSIFDYFGEISHYNSNSITKEQLNNRKLLRDIMVKYNFSPYDNEWWHFSYDKNKYLNSERYDFVIKY